MKHAGSRETLLVGIASDTVRPSLRRQIMAAVRRQSRASWGASLACGLLLVAVVADGPVHRLARSLDPSVAATLRVVTELGNSAWPLGIAALMLVCVGIVARRDSPYPREVIANLRSVLVLVIGSVAVSGTIASLAKHVIGRARPSRGDAPQVFEFAVMSFRASWAAFPSGHATTATACACALAIAFPRQAFAWLSLALVAALSRAFLGVHWLTDSLAGMVLGAVVCLALRNWMAGRGHRFDIEMSLPFRVLGSVASEVLTLGQSAARGALGNIAGHMRRIWPENPRTRD